MRHKIQYNTIQIHPNFIRQIFFLALLVLLGYIIIEELYYMVSAFFGAITLYVILMHPMKYLVIIKKWNPTIASLVLMLISIIVMVIPIAYLTTVVIDKLLPIIENPSIINKVFSQIHQYLNSNFNINILNSENVQKISSEIIPFAKKTLGSTFYAFGNIMIMYLVLYFLLVNTRNVEKWLRQNVPFKTANVKLIIKDIRNLVYSNALGIPIVACVQGLAGLIGYWIFGVEEFILMGLLTAISSVVPIIGSLAIYLPLALYQFAFVGTWQGIGVLLWGVIVIGSVDNIARFVVQKQMADVHPLITLLGVIAGINLFGFIGIIFGPLLISVFFILAGIYIDEFGKVDANNPKI
ncbi:MAG: AI-2E family transporter [Saprospiraceae bacterium]|jgi:predicted PurR-regulated permease PerM|nr:AI-2E family transporter [Saprospiraceae bacterium]MBL0027480.1 AI-2E family transporter [Saprospiraceae bacterium]